MAKHRTHSIAFKRQVVQEYLAGETLHGLARRHDLSRTLIRIWVEKYEAGAFDEDAGLCCKPDVGVSQIRTTTVLSSCFCVGQTVL